MPLPEVGAGRLLSRAAEVGPPTWGSPGAVAMPGDYDGDGRIDVAVYDASTRLWSILQSSTATIRTVTWGGRRDVPLSGNYDGDARPISPCFARAPGSGRSCGRARTRRRPSRGERARTFLCPDERYRDHLVPVRLAGSGRAARHSQAGSRRTQPADDRMTHDPVTWFPTLRVYCGLRRFGSRSQMRPFFAAAMKPLTPFPASTATMPASASMPARSSSSAAASTTPITLR